MPRHDTGISIPLNILPLLGSIHILRNKPEGGRGVRASITFALRGGGGGGGGVVVVGGGGGGGGGGPAAGADFY